MPDCTAKRNVNKHFLLYDRHYNVVFYNNIFKIAIYFPEKEFCQVLIFLKDSFLPVMILGK